MRKYKVFYEVQLKVGVFDIMAEVEAVSSLEARAKALKEIKALCKENRIEREAKYISVKEEVSNG